MNNFYEKLNLQLFGEGGASGGDGADAGSNNSAAEDTSKVIYGKQGDAGPDPDTETVDKRSDFEKLIKGEYKDQFNERVERMIKGRLADDRKSQAAKQQPLTNLLAQKYGVDPKGENLYEDLMKAVEDDRSFWERGAMERGLTVDQYKQMQRLEMENAEFRQLAEQKERDNHVNQLMEEAEALKEIYPGFDFDIEMENPDLMALLRVNVPLRTAFEVIHKDEIMEGAMRFTAQTVQQKTINDIKSRGLRPSENGTRSASSATYKQSVADLNNADIDEIIKRVGKGEKISF